MSRNMAHARCGTSHVVLVHTDAAPTDSEWQAYLDDMERWHADLIGILIVTDGGGPTGPQRRLARLSKGFAGITVGLSVVTRDRLTRGIVIAINVFYPNIRAFHPDDIDAALVHMRGALHKPALLAEVERLQSALRRG